MYHRTCYSERELRIARKTRRAAYTMGKEKEGSCKMRYRTLGRTGFRVSEIGMGLEHLLDKDQDIINSTLHTAIQKGVNYFDCHMGHDYDESSVVYEGYSKLGIALDGVRDKVYLSYISHHMARNPADAQPRFEGYLNALKTEYTDIFMIQFCDKATDYDGLFKEDGLLKYVDQLRQEGKVRYVGISTHSSSIALRAINSGKFDVLMFPINPAFDVVVDHVNYNTEKLESLWDASYDFCSKDQYVIQPRREVYNECARKGVGLIAMKPFAGGFIFKVEAEAGFTAINLISYSLAQNGVSTVVPGCTKPEEIEDILNYYNCAEKDRDYSEAVTKSRWSVNGNCLYCNHCLPCPAGINIGQVNRLLDSYDRDNVDETLKNYSSLENPASACVKCGDCADRCPFKVLNIDRMAKAAELFEKE